MMQRSAGDLGWRCPGGGAELWQGSTEAVPGTGELHTEAGPADGVDDLKHIYLRRRRQAYKHCAVLSSHHTHKKHFITK